jgi:DNA (cytosine-5)-methyltransferase 1
MKKSIKIGSQFSGVGAFDQALNRLGIKYENILQCEWDKYARDTYLLNYEKPRYYVEDVHDTPYKEITEMFGSLDILMSSPPCQSFSMGGKRLGKNDKRGILFFNSYEFIKENKPRYFIFENVRGLLSDDGGKTFSEWVNMLGGKSINGLPVLFPYKESVPYHLYWKIMNAKDYGVPQNRERVFLVGIRNDEDNNFRFPIEVPLQKKLVDVLENSVNDKYLLSERMINGFLNKREEFAKQFKPKSVDDNVLNCITTKPTDKVTCNYIRVRSAVQKGYELATKNDSINYQNIKSTTRRGRVGKGVAQTLDTKCEQGILTDDFRLRKLTPRECFRLMDFPDEFTWTVSDAQAYKQAGNSIVVGVLSNIISRFNL